MTDWAKPLEEDLNWREAEIASLKLLVSEATPATVRHAVLLRALWTMLYAHYEGFCKFAWDYYLDSLQKCNVTRETCCSPIARFSLSKRFKELRKNNSDEALWSVCTAEFDNWMKEELKFEVRLETNSNLWPELVKNNAALISVPSDEVDANEIRLKTLVARRNEIAHGKPMVVQSLDEYQPYENAAFLVMHELALSVLAALEEKLFLNPV